MLEASRRAIAAASFATALLVSCIGLAQDGFQSVQGQVHEDVSGVALLMGAYGAILALFIAYVARLRALTKRATHETAALARSCRELG